MRMTETYLKIAQDWGAQLVDMGNCPIPYGQLPEPGAAAQVNFYSQYQLEDCIYKATDALQQQLEAAEAKLRELEMQEPVGWQSCATGDMSMYRRSENDRPLYAKPFPAPKQEG